MDDNNKDKGGKRLDEDMIKKVVKYTIIGAIVIAILITFVFNRGGPTEIETDDTETPPKKEKIIEDDRDKLLDGVDDKEEEEQEGDVPYADTIEGRAEENKRLALDNLEKADEPVEDDLTDEQRAQLTEDLQGLVDFLAKDYSGFLDGEGDYFSSVGYSESIAGQTEGWMGEQLNFILKDIGYKMDPDTAEWYYSDSDDVYQFAVSLKLEGEEELIISGNYNKDERFFKVFKLHGAPPFGDYAS